MGVDLIQDLRRVTEDFRGLPNVKPGLIADGRERVPEAMRSNGITGDGFPGVGGDGFGEPGLPAIPLPGPADFALTHIAAVLAGEEQANVIIGNSVGQRFQQGHVPHTVLCLGPPFQARRFTVGVIEFLKVSCPIAKYSGKTLGEVMQIDPKALYWVATKFTVNAEIVAAAKLICDEAVKTTA